MDKIINFPVGVHIPRLEIDSNSEFRRYKKHITNIPPDWTHIRESIPTPEYDEYNYIGAATGRRSNITIIDVSYDSPLLYQLFSFEMMKTIRTVRTPNNGYHFMFKYEESLESIYNTREGVNVLNNNRFVLRGKRYKVSVDRPLDKMPENILHALLDYQNNPEPIHQRSYELITMLSPAWFNERDKYIRIVHTLRNLEITSIVARATMRRILVDQNDYVDERTLIAEFGGDMNSRQKRLTLTGLAKAVKEESPQEYEEWHKKWKSRKPIARIKPKKMYYKHGASVKLSELKANQYDITAAKLLKQNPEWITIKVNICKHCKNKHKKECCNNYNWNEKSSCLFVNNIELR